jgi:hypothetical protein
MRRGVFFLSTVLFASSCGPMGTTDVQSRLIAALKAGCGFEPVVSDMGALMSLVYPAAGPIDAVVDRVAKEVCTKVANVAPPTSSPAILPGGAPAPVRVAPPRAVSIILDNGETVKGIVP